MYIYDSVSHLGLFRSLAIYLNVSGFQSWNEFEKSSFGARCMLNALKANGLEYNLREANASNLLAAD